MEKNSMKERESNFEVLRILLTLMVLTVHYNSNGVTGGAFAFAPEGIKHYFLYLTESLACIAVNGFVLITGYFSYKKKQVSYKKVATLILWVVFYNIVFYLFSFCMGWESFRLQTLIGKCIPCNWYVIIYCALICIAPYINILLEQLSLQETKQLLLVLVLLFSVWNTVWKAITGIVAIDMPGISTVGISGDQAGYTIVNFVMLYLIGAAIHKWNLFAWKKEYDILLYLISAGCVFIGQVKGFSMWDYSNTFLLIASIALFNFFQKIRIKIPKIEYISKACFGVYLIHTNWVIQAHFWNLFHINDIGEKSLGYVIANWIGCIIATFVLCSIIDIVCRTVIRFLRKMNGGRKHVWNCRI